MLTWLRKNMKTIMIIIVVLFGASMFYGLGYQGIKGFSGPKTGFVKVNGREVSVQRFNQIYQKLRENAPASLKPQEALFIQNMALSQTIDFAIILAEANKSQRVSGGELNKVLEDIAKNQKFASVDEFKKAVKKSGMDWEDLKKLVRDEMLVNKMVNQIRSGTSVSSSDLREVRARHILVKDEKLANTLLERAKKGEDFAELAKKYSLDPGSKDKGGDLGFFVAGGMVKPFSDLAFSLKVGEIGGPVKTDFGYHVIKVEDARLRKMEGKPDIEKAVLEQKQEQVFSEWYYNLKKVAKVEIEDPALRALDLRFKGRLEEAIVQYQKAIQMNPSNAYLRIFLATLYQDMNRQPLALSEYKDAVQVSSGDPILYLLYGQALYKQGEKEQALEQFKKASLIAGDRKPLHEELLRSYTELGIKPMIQIERDEIHRLEKKELFEKSLQVPVPGTGTNKVKTD